MAQRDAYCYRTVSNCELITARPQQLAILGGSAPLSVLGAALLVDGSVRRQTSAHILHVIEMQKSEERARSGGKQPPPARPRRPPRPPRTRADPAR